MVPKKKTTLQNFKTVKCIFDKPPHIIVISDRKGREKLHFSVPHTLPIMYTKVKHYFKTHTHTEIFCLTQTVQTPTNRKQRTS